MGRMSPNKQSDRDVRLQDSALIHSVSHGSGSQSQMSPKIQSNNTSPASFSPRDLSANVNGLVKYTSKSDEQEPDEVQTLLDQTSNNTEKT